MKNRLAIDIVILAVLVLSLALVMDLSRQGVLPSWMSGFPIFAVVVAYGVGKARGRKERSDESAPPH
jgi:uncharacterized membrane protein (GlpM family)